CEPLFGVFAPSHKVQLEKSNEAKASSKAIASSTPKSGAKLSALTKKHSGSQESIISEKSSIISAASAVNKNSIQRKPVPKQIQITPNAALINNKKPVTTSNNNVIQSTVTTLKKLNSFFLVLKIDSTTETGIRQHSERISCHNLQIQLELFFRS
ncbi:hypothetical protein BpHYR1_000049, partial [Brachionus plicatilis]